SGFGDYRFVGLANYRRMLADPLFRQSLRVTLTYFVLLVPSLYVAGLGVALVWQVLLVDKVGIITRFGSIFGAGAISWLGDPRWALIALGVVSVWFLM